MAECGDKYAHLVRTANGLTTVRRHGGVMATEVDYQHWNDAAIDMRAKVNRQWSLLRKAELERESGTELSDSLRHSIGAYTDAVQALPTPWNIWDDPQTKADPAPRIDQAVDVMVMGACELEKIDDAAASIGVDVPEVPGPKPSPGSTKGIGGIVESVKTVAILAIVGTAVYYTAKLVIAARKSAPTPLAEGMET